MARKTKKLFFHSSVVLGSLIILFLVIFFYHKTEQAKADQFLPSDLNQDGIVDTKDIDLIKQNYANSAGGILNPSPYDLNNDHKINSLDLAIVEDNQGNGTNPERDWDKDGWSVGEGDCEDRDSEMHPIAKEKADGIDNNCNGSVDDFADYQPLVSNSTYVVALHFSKNATPHVQVTSTKRISSSESMRTPTTIGEYAIEVRDPQNKLLDAVGVADCTRDTPFSTQGEALNECDARVLVPDTSAGNTLHLVSTVSADVSIPVSISSSNAITVANAEDGLTHCTGGWEKYATLCLNFENYSPATIAQLKLAFEMIDQNIPYLTYIPLDAIQILQAGMPEACPQAGGVVACHHNGTISIAAQALLGQTDATIQTVLTHELSHYFAYLLDSYVVAGNSESGKLLKSKVDELVRFVNELNCDSNPKKCQLKPQALGYDFTKYVTHLLLNMDPFVVNNSNPDWQNMPTWDDVINPATQKTDPWGPRPATGIELIREYAVTRQSEVWATYFEGIYLDKINMDRAAYPGDTPYEEYSYMSSLESVYHSTPRYPDISGLAKGLSILGKYGLIKDWDYDGIPDEYDNCSPRAYAALCKPGEMEACYNPNQEDFVDHNGTVLPNGNGIGDKCEFQGQPLYFSTCYKGMMPPVSFSSPLVPNCPDYSNPDFPGGFCTSPRILTSVGGKSLFGDDPIKAHEAICKAAG